MSRVNIDSLDRRIVERLRIQGRESNRSLAHALGVNESTIASRLRRLESEDVMRVVALTDTLRLGLPFFAFALIKVDRFPVSEVAREIGMIPHTIFVSTILGRYDIVCGILARNNDELADILGHGLPKIDGVAEVRCELALDVVRFDSAWAALRAEMTLDEQPSPRLLSDQLDSLDLGIISSLQQDARRTLRSVAEPLNVSETTVRARLRRLEDEKIVRIRAVSDVEAFGLSVAAVIGVRTADGAADSVKEALARIDNLGALARTAGEFDFVLFALVESREGLVELLTNKIHSIPSVRRTETFEVIDNTKHIYTWVRLVD